jgi:hypothetical protein
MAIELLFLFRQLKDWLWCWPFTLDFCLRGIIQHIISIFISISIPTGLIFTRGLSISELLILPSFYQQSSQQIFQSNTSQDKLSKLYYIHNSRNRNIRKILKITNEWSSGFISNIYWQSLVYFIICFSAKI